MIRTAITQNTRATAVVMNFASRYITSPTNMDQSEIDSYTVLLQASMDAKDVRTHSGMLKNIVIIIANKINDIPAWFYLDNPNVKNILLRTPSKEEREQLVKSERFPSFFAGDIYREEAPYYEEHPDELEKVQDKFIGMTEGFSFTELNGLRRLAKNQRVHIGENIVVFDFIREDVADQILKAQVQKIIANLQAEKKIILSVSDPAMEVLRTKAVANLDNGGRGIGNIVESLLINPLSRYLFDNEIFESKTVIIENIHADVQPYCLSCTVS